VERLERSEYQRLYCELAAQWLVLAHEAESDEARAPRSTGQMHRVINQERFPITRACGENEALRDGPVQYSKLNLTVASLH